MYWSESFGGELSAAKQSSCIDKTYPCFVLVSYYMLKSWAVIGCLMYDFTSGQIVVMDDCEAFQTCSEKKGRLTVAVATRNVQTQNCLDFETWIMKKRKGFDFVTIKLERFRFSWTPLSCQPSQPRVQETDHRARVDGNSWIGRNRMGEYSAGTKCSKDHLCFWKCPLI